MTSARCRALHSMDPDVIVYLGTASKVLATAFGAGWLVARRARRPAGGAAPAPGRPHPRAGPARDPRPAPRGRPGAPYPQDAPGVRPSPRRPGRPPDPRGARTRRTPDLDGCRSGCSATPPACTWSWSFPCDFPVGRLIDAAAERGVTVYPLDRYFAGTPTMNGLIIGYGTATLPQLRRAAAELALLLRRSSRGRADHRLASTSLTQSAIYALTYGRWSSPMCSAPPSSGVNIRSSRRGLATA